MASEWKGSYYKRVRSNDYRNREHGDVVKNVTLKKIRGMRNKALVFDGKNWKSVELKNRNFYGFDMPPNINKSAKRKFEKRIMSTKERRAMFARMKGRRR